MLVSSGGAGVGGWAFQDDPRLVALWTLVAGKPADAGKSPLDGSLVTQVVDVFKPRDSFTQPGSYQVTISKVQLDPKLFRLGRTVNIQARVKKLEPNGRDKTLWDAKQYGERLAVVGKDDLTAGWPHRPFQVDWNPGDDLILEVYVGGPNVSANEFPLKPGDFPLVPLTQTDASIDPRVNHVVIMSEHIGDARPREASPPQIAERPIVIK
jgi:hypothetical protein